MIASRALPSGDIRRRCRARLGKADSANLPRGMCGILWLCLYEDVGGNCREAGLPFDRNARTQALGGKIIHLNDRLATRSR